VNIKSVDADSGMLIYEDGPADPIEWMRIDYPLFCMSCGKLAPLGVVSIKVEGRLPEIDRCARLCANCLKKIEEKVEVDQWMVSLQKKEK